MTSHKQCKIFKNNKHYFGLGLICFGARFNCLILCTVHFAHCSENEVDKQKKILYLYIMFFVNRQVPRSSVSRHAFQLLQSLNV